MEELYRENAELVYRFLSKLCGDRALAEELTQETFLQAYKSIDYFDGNCKISVWLCQIGKHLYYQYLRKHRREIPADAEEIYGQKAGTDIERQVLERFELVETFREMQNLPQQIREVMYLRISADLSFREIGEILGKSENWARVNFYRGKEKLLQLRERSREEREKGRKNGGLGKSENRNGGKKNRRNEDE